LHRACGRHGLGCTMGQTCSQTCTYSRYGLQPTDSRGAAPQRSAAPTRGREGEHEEPVLAFHLSSFQTSVVCSSSAQPPAAAAAAGSEPDRGPRAGWRSSYALGPMLGDGVSAKVYLAEALPPGHSGGPPGGVRGPELDPAALWGSCSGLSMPQCLRERGRRVAIKRFHRVGSKTFQKELDALNHVGVHPHILRLVESYQGFDGEDVLILEYCDGSTMYDLYAREHGNGGLPEKLIVRLIRQLLLALEHLAECGVEHQDVKPENMMLHDVSVSNCHGELKIGDFGWASMAPPPGSSARSRLPTTGAGSLWYAPPELNPPIKGSTVGTELPVDSRGCAIVGRSDMWSVGVVLYLLLIGHNPFNVALNQKQHDAVDHEVIRLAALGEFNRSAVKWQSLDMDARNFIGMLLRVKPIARPSATEALQHPFLMKRIAQGCGKSSVSVRSNVAAWADREADWKRLDGFQRLSWLAVARAVAEPELDRSTIDAAMDGMTSGEVLQGFQDATYLGQLARELAMTPIFQWLQDRGAWASVLRVAFAYLDVDADGLLSPADLAAHVARPGPPPAGAVLGKDHSEGFLTAANTLAWALSRKWVARWAEAQVVAPEAARRGAVGLPLSSFREALLCSRGVDEAVPGGLEASGRGPADYGRGGGHEEEINWTDMGGHTGPGA